MAKKGKKSAPKKKINGYKMPPPIPPGEIIRHGDKKWLIGPSIGVGGFGEIYSASEYKEGEALPTNEADYPYVVKIEPVENGPLFVEMHFYNRNYNKTYIEQFMRARNLDMLGMPTYIGSGSQFIQGEELRFLIIERYGKDLWKILKEVGKKFPAPTVFQLGLQMLDVLDYVHSRSYIHADIKGANILLGIKEGTENQAYLLDFGLAYRIVDDNYKPDPKSAHEGTIEYTSTDRHIGAKTMRGDLEILGYNLLHWLVGSLPWEDVLDDPKAVYKMKSDLMDNVRTRITTDYPEVPDELIQFFEYVKKLQPKDVPDYTICRNFFETYLSSVGRTRSSQLEFRTTVENDSHSQSEEIEEQIITKSKKSKPKVNKDSEIVSISGSDSVNEVDNQEGKIRKILKNKRKKSKTFELIELSYNNAENEQSEQNQEVIKTKKGKRKKTEDMSPAENDDENEYPDVNQEEVVTKPKKKKKQKEKDHEDTSQLENDDENEVLSNINKKKMTKNKKRNRENSLDFTSPNDVNTESEQFVQNTKRKKKKTENTPPEDTENVLVEEEQVEVTAKRNKRTRDRKSYNENEDEDEISDESDEYQEPAKKKRRTKKSTPKNKTKEKSYQKSSRKAKHKKNKKKKKGKIDFNATFKDAKVPVKKIDNSPGKPGLRSDGKTCRPDYSNM